MSTTFSIRIDEETKGRLERLAKSTSRTKSYLVADAIKEYIEINEWQIREIKQAIEEADRPAAKFIDHEKIRAKWEGRRAHPLDRKGRQKS
jgi:predicted transcriptional regulator